MNIRGEKSLSLFLLADFTLQQSPFLLISLLGNHGRVPVQNLLMRSKALLGTTGALGLAPCRRPAMDQQYNKPIT